MGAPWGARRAVRRRGAASEGRQRTGPSAGTGQLGLRQGYVTLGRQSSLHSWSKNSSHPARECSTARASLSSSLCPLREAILADRRLQRGGLRETGGTLFPLFSRPCLPLPTATVSLFHRASDHFHFHGFLSGSASLVVRPSPPSPTPLPLPQPPAPPLLAHSLPLPLSQNRRQPHKQEVAKKKKKRRGVCRKAFAHLKHFPVPGSQVLPVFWLPLGETLGPAPGTLQLLC